MQLLFSEKFLSLDSFSLIIISLITFIGLCVSGFAQRYLMGDQKYKPFFIKLFFLLISTSVMVSADNLIALFISWCLSNALLVSMMIHKSNWKAAKASGMLALKNFFIGATCLASAFVVLHHLTSELSIQALTTAIYLDKSPLISVSLSLILVASMIQSAIWPFHRWLLSSLNSPTPVSAIMHAGLISGGGILLIRFAPLFTHSQHFLNLIFIIGLITALIGSLWKLMQSDVKRMLACSTMAQMGFMFMQIGLGLFSAAIAHIVWHGLFKAYLFLSSGAAAQEKRFGLDYPPRLTTFFASLACGLTGTFIFSLVSGKSLFATDTTQFLLFVVFLCSSQVALSLLSNRLIKNFFLSLIFANIFGLVYGFNVYIITCLLESMNFEPPQTLNSFHINGLFILSLAWLASLFASTYKKENKFPPWVRKFYVFLLNSSQPAPSTITPNRNQYKYL